MGSGVIGVDLGGTNLRTAVLSRDGEIITKRKEATHAVDGKEKVISKLIENIRQQCEFARSKGIEITGVGVGAPGIIHGKKGVVVKSPNFPDWNNLPLRHEIEAGIKLPVFIENDANAAALGEQWQGAGRDIRTMILLTLGTGVGGGIVLDGSLWHGADGMAGEIGHMTIVPDGRRCSCGNTGCLETYASARGIVQSYREALIIQRASKEISGAELTSETVYKAAREGDGKAVRVMQDMGRYLGIGVANLINIFNPEMVVIGGGVKDAWPLFIDSTRSEIFRRAFEYPARRTDVVQSRLGDDAGMIGAAAVALQMLEKAHVRRTI